MNSNEIEIFSRCTRRLNYHRPKSPAETLKELAAAMPATEVADHYGGGEGIESFEKEVAALLGKESAVFMPSGTMAQPIALRIWCDRQKNKNFGLHATSHLELHEQHGYLHLQGLNGILLGEKSRMFTLGELKACPETLAAVILELPYRELGGVLPSWADLQAMSAYCREQKIYFHLDGARLWEAGPFYGKPYAQTAALFDSVYVSFYKGIGAIAGAVLAGPKTFIEEAKIWQRRQGGNLVSLYPYVVSCRLGLAERLPQMRAYHEKAVAIAEGLAQFSQLTIKPQRPQTNMMHIFFAGDQVKYEAASLEIARTDGVALFRRLQKKGEQGMLELTVGDAALEIPTEEIIRLFARVLS